LLHRFSKNYHNVKFHENPSNVNRIFPCGRVGGQTEDQDEVNGRFS